MYARSHQARAFFLRCRASRFPTGLPERAQILSARTYATESTRGSVEPLQDGGKPYYITSPIFYVNAAPHVGHLYTLILTDIISRWQKLLQKRATLLTGTDEHGMKIQREAQRFNTAPKLFCDHHAQQFERLAQAANVEYDRFIRTTDADHKETVEHFWRELNHHGYIYESKHEGWYSVSDETFYPESRIHLILDPRTGRKIHASMETGKEVEWTSETNYRFRLSEFQDRLLQHYRENPEFIVPSPRMNFITKEVQSGLQDLSISRPSSRLSWGIAVPGDPSQTIYVWLDALLNYLTMTGYPFASEEQTNSLWPPNCQVIGKDIIRFHTIYWPAFLMAVGLPLPKQFLCHGHWTINHEKMSKSLGNVVDPFWAMERFGVDVIRFYMAIDGGIADDRDYDNSYIVQRYKKILQGGFGNLITRMVRGKKWSVRRSVISASERADASLLSAEDKRHIELINKTSEIANEQMNLLNPRSALQDIINLVTETNKYLQGTQVWNLADKQDEKSQLRVEQIVYLCTESARVAAILLQPFMPTKMKLALDWLGVAEANRTFYQAEYSKDLTYGEPFVDVGTAGPDGTIFPPLILEE